MNDELQKELEWIDRILKNREVKAGFIKLKKNIIREEHARLRAAFEKHRIPDDNNSREEQYVLPFGNTHLLPTEKDIAIHNGAIDRCKSELQPQEVEHDTTKTN